MAHEERFRFGRALRLRRRREFLAVQRGGIRRRGRYLTVIARRAEDPRAPARLGITASRKVGGAVTRNRVKRLVREAFRTSRSEIPAALDIVVVAKPSAGEASLGDVRRELVGAARALGRRLATDGGRP